MFMMFIKLLFESFLMAFHAVKVNKMRTILTLLGITIGIFSIISVFTTVDSMESSIRESISSLGDNVVYVQKWPWSFENDYKWWEYLKRPVPKISEYEEIVHKAQTVELAAFSVSTMRQVKYRKNSYENGIIWANTHQFNEIRTFEIDKGRYFSYFESQTGKNLAIIGTKIANELFKKEDPLDKYIKIEGHKIKVIGVIKKEGKGIFGSFDDIVLLPMNYARNIFDVRSENLDPLIMVKAKPSVSLEQMKEELRKIMRNKRSIRPLQADNFALNQASTIIKGISQIFIVINIAGWLIGGFSIIVGGFGIANIMFVSVRERTNQIGIQKALGAKKIFILFEFIYESVMLALAGGTIGLLLVYGGTSLVSHMADFNIALTMGNVLLGVFVSIIIGITAGLAPALVASRLNPVEAINTTF
jgi:putative ABC transport system permease protein